MSLGLVVEISESICYQPALPLSLFSLQAVVSKQIQTSYGLTGVPKFELALISKTVR